MGAVMWELIRKSSTLRIECNKGIWSEGVMAEEKATEEISQQRKRRVRHLVSPREGASDLAEAVLSLSAAEPSGVRMARGNTLGRPWALARQRLNGAQLRQRPQGFTSAAAAECVWLQDFSLQGRVPGGACPPFILYPSTKCKFHEGQELQLLLHQCLQSHEQYLTHARGLTNTRAVKEQVKGRCRHCRGVLEA